MNDTRLFITSDTHEMTGGVINTSNSMMNTVAVWISTLYGLNF